jgi:hypothetical protein
MGEVRALFSDVRGILVFRLIHLVPAETATFFSKYLLRVRRVSIPTDKLGRLDTVELHRNGAVADLDGQQLAELERTARLGPDPVFTNGYMRPNDNRTARLLDKPLNLAIKFLAGPDVVVPPDVETVGGEFLNELSWG